MAIFDWEWAEIRPLEMGRKSSAIFGQNLIKSGDILVIMGGSSKIQKS